MTEKDIRESTLSFNYEEEVYENAAEMPVMYRSLGLEPRHSHPFWIYEAIQRQPELVEESLRILQEPVRQIARAYVERGCSQILLTGIGASFHLGVSGTHLLGEIAGIPAAYVESSEALFSKVAYAYEKTMVIGLSASGNSKETVEHVREARKEGALVASFVNLNGTRLVEESEITGVAAGGYGFVWDYTTRLAGIAMLAIELARVTGRDSQQIARYESELQKVPELMRQTLDAIDERCQLIGEQMAASRAAVIPASGHLLPVGWEFALRCEEMAHFPAKGRPIVDFLHGGVGYLAEDISTVILAGEATREYVKRVALVAREIRSPAFAVVRQDDREVSPLVDWTVRLPAVEPAFEPFLFLLPAQVIPYYIELAQGGNPDAQRTDQPRYARAFNVAYPPKSH